MSSIGNVPVHSLPPWTVRIHVRSEELAWFGAPLGRSMQQGGEAITSQAPLFGACPCAHRALLCGSGDYWMNCGLNTGLGSEPYSVEMSFAPTRCWSSCACSLWQVKKRTWCFLAKVPMAWMAAARRVASMSVKGSSSRKNPSMSLR